PNWRRKLPVSFERWKTDPRMQQLAASMAQRSMVKDGSASGPKRVPVATYRLQLHKGFRFTDATALVPYLERLGVSHVYASPFLKARPGSVHGDNPWWQDVLEKGRASRYAKFFDIDWLRGRGRLLLPVLGKHYGEALDEGEVKLVREGKRGPWRV